MTSPTALPRLIGEAVNAERVRLARDLHDGAQQRIVHTLVVLKLAQRALRTVPLCRGARMRSDRARPTGERRAARTCSRDAAGRPDTTRAACGRGSPRLARALAGCGGRVSRPTRSCLEGHAYFIIAEALTNVSKHSRASAVAVHAGVYGDVLRLEVRDDGIGGAHREGGSGLRGLEDRVAPCTERFV